MLSFGKDVVAAKSQDVAKSNEQVIDSVLALRGFGTTDVAGALDAAAAQLSRSRAGRKIVVLLSDCRATTPGDVPAAARRLAELVIVAPESDDAEARELAEQVGARFTTVDRSIRRSGSPRPRARHLTDHAWGLTPGVIVSRRCSCRGRCRTGSLRPARSAAWWPAPARCWCRDRGPHRRPAVCWSARRWCPLPARSPGPAHR